MRIVVVGSGGREHALAARLAGEGHAVVAVPGNPGMASLARLVAVDAGNAVELFECVRAQAPELVVVGPEAPLAAGLGDRLREAGIPVFGPSARAARIESSKGFAKEVMVRAGVPTADYVLATTVAEADAAIERMQGRCAVKADGLAAGKGVVVCTDAETAREAARAWLAQGPVVVEELLEGPEVSVIAMTDGRALALLPAARDHKRLGDGDTGPNTGGMGAVCPVPMSEADLELVRERVMRPVLQLLERDGTPFCGALYAGLMLTPRGPRVLEFNARFGDPETQSIMAALSPEVAFGQLCLDAAQGRLQEASLTASQAACTVVVASAGYPQSARTGDEISGLEQAESDGARVIHAGTRLVDGRLVSAGGRVLGVVATGPDLTAARERANAAAARVQLAGAQWRRDIGASTTGA